MHGSLPFTYLGASIGSSPSSVKFWDPLLQRLKRKLSGFAANNVSMSGKFILLMQEALDSTLIYWLSLYKLPVSVANNIERLCRQFPWGESSHVPRKIHLIGWDRICKDKQAGGLGLPRYNSETTFCSPNGGGGHIMNGVPFGIISLCSVTVHNGIITWED